jgi:nicotinamidase-related amidase
MKDLTPMTALLVIDVQAGFDDGSWGARDNPMAEANIARLLEAWRAMGWPVIHIHHDSRSPTGSFRRGTAGHTPKPEAAPQPHEPAMHKAVNSAFIGTSLEANLRRNGIASVVIVGLTTNHCVSTTARMAGNLGFDTFVVSDATATFDRAALDGRLCMAEDVHGAALSDLKGEFAEVVDTEEVLNAMPRACGAAIVYSRARLRRAARRSWIRHLVSSWHRDRGDSALAIYGRAWACVDQGAPEVDRLWPLSYPKKAPVRSSASSIPPRRIAAICSVLLAKGMRMQGNSYEGTTRSGGGRHWRRYRDLVIARVLSDNFEQVAVIERDPYKPAAEGPGDAARAVRTGG